MPTHQSQSQSPNPNPTASQGHSYSYLALLDLCDNVHLHRPAPLSVGSDGEPVVFDAARDERLVPLHLSPAPARDSPAIGLLRPEMVVQLVKENERSRARGAREVWAFDFGGESPAATAVDITTDTTTAAADLAPRKVSFAAWLDTPAKRTAAMSELCGRWRDAGLFADVCGPRKWRGEMYAVYVDPFGVWDRPLALSVSSSSSSGAEGAGAGGEGEEGEGGKTLNFAFEMERSACALFGVVTYGVHLNVYEEVVQADGTRGGVRMWVPTRALSKPTFPGLLDNTVAGGIPSGMRALDALVKECEEEASLAPEVVRAHVRAVGSISYFYRAATGWLQPEVEYVYDIVIPPGADPALFTPRPSDGEVESFEFMDHDKLVTRLRAGKFKPNCALVILDLFIRLGYITPDNEPDFLKIVNRLHGTFGYALW